MTPPEPGRRHVWVEVSGGYRYPGLVMGWRRAEPVAGHPAGWEAQVAIVMHKSVLVTWEPAAALHLVVDDSWAHPYPKQP